jgi:hypothetical protein
VQDGLDLFFNLDLNPGVVEDLYLGGSQQIGLFVAVQQFLLGCIDFGAFVHIRKFNLYIDLEMMSYKSKGVDKRL